MSAWRIILCVLLLVGAVGGIVALIVTQSGEENPEEATKAPLLVTYPDGTELFSGSSFGAISDMQPLLLKINREDVSVRVSPSNFSNFSFAVDGTELFFNSGMDLTEGFNIKIEGGTLSVTPRGDIDSIIRRCYDGDISIDFGAIDYEVDMFELQISCESKTYTATFSIEHSEVRSVHLTEGVVF